MPAPSVVRARFEALEAQGPDAALNWLYEAECACGYVRRDVSARPICWSAPTPAGTLELTINLAKPEKDPRVIAAAAGSAPSAPAAMCGSGAAAVPPGREPLCDLCWENEGWPGSPGHPAKPGLRIIPLRLGGERWGLQFSPYAYFPEHCIALSAEHRPMKVDAAAVARLLDFADRFPGYFIGSNADVPIVGGSVLSHDHYQGGRHVFPLMRAPIAHEFALPGLSGVRAGIVEWPASTVRLASSDRTALLEAASRVMNAWRAFDDEGCGIVSRSRAGGAEPGVGRGPGGAGRPGSRMTSGGGGAGAAGRVAARGHRDGPAGAVAGAGTGAGAARAGHVPAPTGDEAAHAGVTWHNAINPILRKVAPGSPWPGFEGSAHAVPVPSGAPGTPGEACGSADVRPANSVGALVPGEAADGGGAPASRGVSAASGEAAGGAPLYVLDLVLRNNRTTPERPWGLFHPRESLFHIKRENIGLIEIMGRAILPPRLARELPAVDRALHEAALAGEAPDALRERLAADPPTASHAEWAAGVLARRRDELVAEARVGSVSRPGDGGGIVAPGEVGVLGDGSQAAGPTGACVARAGEGAEHDAAARPEGRCPVMRDARPAPAEPAFGAVLRDEVAQVFCRVLEDAAVFKSDEAGRRGWARLLAALGA